MGSVGMVATYRKKQTALRAWRMVASLSSYGGDKQHETD